MAKTTIVQFSICRHPKKKREKPWESVPEDRPFSGGWWAAAKCCLCVIQVSLMRITVLHPWVLDLTELVGLTWVFPVILIKVLFYSGHQKTNIMAKSCLGHPKISDEVCVTEATHVMIFPLLLAPTLHLNTPLHWSSSCCSTETHNSTILHSLLLYIFLRPITSFNIHHLPLDSNQKPKILFS